MKYKLNESPTSGAGRPRSCPMTSTHPTGKSHKDDISLKTRSNKTNKNEDSVLRRSSRRATIERRVWAIPKKPAKLAPTSVKGKTAQKAGKKGKEKKTQNKVQVKNFSKCKSSQGTKRGLVTLEEAGNARRKVKKKEGVRDVGSNMSAVNEISVLSPSAIKKKVILESLEDAVKEDIENDYSSQSRITYQENKASIDSSNDCGGTSKCIVVTDVRTGIPSEASSKDDYENFRLSTLHNENVNSDRGIEETLFTGEICLNKAVIEEIVPDYEISDSQTADKNVNTVSCKKASLIEGVNSSHLFRNIEDVLGHSYSKVKSLSSDNSKDLDKQKCDNDSPEETEKSEREISNYASTGTSSDQLVIKRQLCSVEEELSETKTRLLIDTREKELTDTDKPKLDVCSKSEYQETKLNRKGGIELSDVKDRDIKENFLENTVVSRESVYDIRSTFLPEKDNCKLLGNKTQKFCAQTEDTVVVPIDHPGAEPHQDDEEEDHVSLSVALAQLVDSDNGGEAEGTETVTIHSASSVVQVEEEERNRIVAVEVSSKDEVIEKSESHDDAEDEEGELVIKEEDDDDENDDESSDDNTDEDEETFNTSADGKRESKIQNCITLINSEKPEICLEADCERDTTYADVPPSPPPKLKKQIPPLIKISSRPPAIKTPLKCPECPMQFCTVRSLLWHFGTHGAQSRENCVPPILLQDLIVPWDKPTVSLFISQSPETDKIAEKAVSLAETVVPTSDVTGKIDMASKQGLTVSAQIIRTEDYLGTNGDVILKVPIPRLKPKTQATSSVKKDKFVNILPKMTTGDGQATSHSMQANPQPAILKPSSSCTPQITIHPQNNRSVDVVTVKPQHQIPKITIRADNPAQQVQIQPVVSSCQSAIQIQPLVSSQSSVQIQPFVSSCQSTVQIQPLVSSVPSTVQIQPLVSSSQSGVPIQPLVPSTSSTVQVQPVVTSTKATSTAPSHIALIPVDNLTAVGQSLNPRASKISHAPISMIAPSPLPSKTSTAVDGILEKDGLVMINSNLALRIVSSLPSTLDTNTSTTNTTTIRPIASHLTNNLTILPQVDGSKLVNSKREGTKNPDILTIVPQVDLSKKVSLLKTATPIPSPQVANAPNSSAAPSQVVKLYLLQPKDPKNNDNSMKFGITAETSNRVNGIEIPLPIPNRKDRVKCENMLSKNLKESEDEDDDEGMVIDDEKEGEDDMMDPLSLCAVTMEDENLDASNITNQSGQFNLNAAAGSNDKVTIKKLPVRAKGKSNQVVDIVKYEARKYVCCYCNRRFGWSTDLKRHVILHTGEKPFECKVCPVAFTRKFLLQNHMKRMHPDKCKMSDLWP